MLYDPSEPQQMGDQAHQRPPRPLPRRQIRLIRCRRGGTRGTGDRALGVGSVVVARWAAEDLHDAVVKVDVLGG